MSTKRSRTTIDVASLLPGGVDSGDKSFKWQDTTKARTLNWTREQGEGAAKKSHFKVVGVLPQRTSTKKASTTSKVNTRWRISNAEKRWEDDSDIVYIANIFVKDNLVDFFPGSYSDRDGILEDGPGLVLPLWIAGPRASVIEMLVHQKILPAAPESKYNQWVDSVAITSTNYTDVAAEQFTTLKNADQTYVKAKQGHMTVDVVRISQLNELASHLKRDKSVVEILDVNGTVIGTYGKQVTKPANNVFTDFVKRYLEKNHKVDESIIDISRLTADRYGKVVRASYPSNVDVESGEYGTNRKRPLALVLTFIDAAGVEHELPQIWTSRIKPVDILFAELTAVNNSTITREKFQMSGTRDIVRSSVLTLLDQVEESKERDTTPKVLDYDTDALYKK